MKNIIKKLLEKIMKKFFCAPKKNYLDTLKKEFKNKVFSMNSFRSNKNDAFKIYLGIIIDTSWEKKFYTKQFYYQVVMYSFMYNQMFLNS